jgi:hypothetical protein
MKKEKKYIYRKSAVVYYYKIHENLKHKKVGIKPNSIIILLPFHLSSYVWRF